MKLLVTNPRTAQAYAIIRALRPFAQKVVVTMYGDNRLLARFSHAANSRLVDSRYCVPSPVEDWRAGRISQENTEREEAYVQAVLKICEKEKIDTIFPSFDPQVYVFSKNKERFQKMGIVIPVPDYEAVVTAVDKYRTIQAAQEAGFPCPRTHLPRSEGELEGIAADLGFPVMVKPRMGTAGQGAGIARDLSDLIARFRRASARGSVPLVQEYIPGSRIVNFHLILDREGRLKLAFSLGNRANSRIRGGFGRGQYSTAPHEYLPVAVRILQRAGYWGSAHVAAKVDDRDGVPKFMEINPRFGNRLWTRSELGINEPWMCVEIARGNPVKEVKDYPLGVSFLDPVEDAMLLPFQVLDLAIYRFRTGVRGKEPIDSLNPPMTLKELATFYKRVYLSRDKKAVNPYCKFFFQDPIVSMLWWCQYSTYLVRASKQIGQ